MRLPRRSTHIAQLLLRIGLAIVFVWFGLHQLYSPQSWTAWIPSWFLNLGWVDAVTFIRGHALVNVALGLLLLSGWQVRWIAIGVTLWLFDIVAVNGFTPETTRDIGLLFASLALAFLPDKDF